MNVVMDTDVWSFVFKGDTRADRYLPYLADKTVCVSFQTVAELYQWAEMRRWGAKRVAAMEDALHNFVVLPYDVTTGRIWGKISAVRYQLGLPMAATDAWIAACALRYACPLVTHNQDDFVRIEGLTMITR